jgi:hypothetical protein
MSLNSIHKELIQDYIEDKNNEDELLLWMVLIHTHQIRLSSALLVDAHAVSVIEPATQRVAAGVIAELWPGINDMEKTSYAYWYRKYQLKTPFETLADLPSEKVLQIEKLRRKVESDSRVVALTPV